MLDYLIRVDTGGSERAIRASVSPEAWFRILAEIAPESVASSPNPNDLRGADRLAARAFQDVAAEAVDAGEKEFLVRSSDLDLIGRIRDRAAALRADGVVS